MRISDWSSDVCSSDLRLGGRSIYDPAVIVVLIAVSRFDEINAAYGRNVGDTLLEAIGRRLSRMVDDDDGESTLVSRLGGAEFAIALSGPVTLAQASFLAHRVGARFERPFLYEGPLCPLRCPTGMAVVAASRGSPDRLFGQASAAWA